MLLNDHDVKILDLDIMELSDNELADYVAPEKPDYIGVSVATPMVAKTQSIFKVVEHILPQCVKVIGGPHPSSMPTQSLEHTGADVSVVGEGEYSFKELVEGVPYQRIKGIAFKDGTSFVSNEPRPPIEDLNSLPFPAHHMVPRDKYRMSPYFDSYYSESERPIFSSSVITSRSCPYQCIFCATKKIFGGKVRFRSPQNVVDEVEYLNKELGVRAMMFVDDCFTLNKNRTTEICQQIIRRRIDIKWWIDTRVDHVSEELLQVMKEAGCRFIVYGVEAGSQRILDLIQKKITIEQVKRAFALTHNIGIDTKANFMLGHPTETEDEMIQSVNLAKELNPTKTAFYLVLPLPGTELYDIAQSQNLITKDFSQFMWYHLPVSNISGVSEKRLKEIQRWAYKVAPGKEPTPID